MSAPSPRPSGERIKGEGGRLHPQNALLQVTVSGLPGEDRQEVAAEQEPLTLDPLPARAGRGSTHRDHLIKRNQFCRQFYLMRPMLSPDGGVAQGLGNGPRERGEKAGLARVAADSSQRWALLYFFDTRNSGAFLLERLLDSPFSTTSDSGAGANPTIFGLFLSVSPREESSDAVARPRIEVVAKP